MRTSSRWQEQASKRLPRSWRLEWPSRSLLRSWKPKGPSRRLLRSQEPKGPSMRLLRGPRSMRVRMGWPAIGQLQFSSILILFR
jgi:hypothetical protein